MRVLINQLPTVVSLTDDYAVAAMLGDVTVQIPIGAIVDNAIADTVAASELAVSNMTDAINAQLVETAAAVAVSVAASDAAVVAAGEALGSAVLFTEQTLSGGEQLQVRTNIGTGQKLGHWYGEYLTYSSHTATIPLDDTIPQITEGTEFISIVTDALKSASNRVRITVAIPASCLSLTYYIIAALFIDGEADAVASSTRYQDHAGNPDNQQITYEFAPGAVDPLTISLRIGPSTASTLYVNGTSSARRLGGTMGITVVVEELEA